MTTRIEFTASYYGDNPPTARSVTADGIEMEPHSTANTSVDTSEPPLRVRLYGIVRADLAALQGTGWTRCRFPDPKTGRAWSGAISALESVDDDTLSFVLNPDSEALRQA